MLAIVVYIISLAGIALSVANLSRDKREIWNMILMFAMGMIFVLLMMAINDRIKY